MKSRPPGRPKSTGRPRCLTCGDALTPVTHLVMFMHNEDPPAVGERLADGLWTWAKKTLGALRMRGWPVPGIVTERNTT